MHYQKKNKKDTEFMRRRKDDVVTDREFLNAIKESSDDIVKDDIYYFLMSLGPGLRSMSARNRELTKIKIQSLMFEMTFPQHDNPVALQASNQISGCT